MNKKYIGNYLGIVLQNDDPEHRGRVKIFVPHVSITIYEKWHKDKTDKAFKFPDKISNPDLINIIEPLKDVLPWAECAAPLFGGNASARYNAYDERGTVSDSNYWENNEFKQGNRPIQNFIGETDANGASTLGLTISANNIYKDAFSKTDINGNRFVNEYSYQYAPSNYSNLARGLFTIPNVGAHVWVFFAEGNPNLPVYFAASHGGEDWKRIFSFNQTDTNTFTSPDYPATYENITKQEDPKKDSDTRTFRAKTVFNSNKHSIELIDTDNRETLKLTHFSGSFKAFCNYANIEFASNNDQKMVIGDQFYTVQRNQSVFIGKSQELIVAGDRYKTIGLKQYEAAEKILKILREIHEYKRLFEGRRATISDPPNEVSKYQVREGTFTTCPVCKGNMYEPKTWIIQPAEWQGERKTQEELIASSSSFSSMIGKIGYYLGSACATCNPLNSGNNKGFSPSTQDGIWIEEPYKKPGAELDKLIKEKTPELMELQRILGEGDEIVTIAKNKVENIGLVMNDLKSFRIDPIGKLRIDSVNVALEGVYPTFKVSPHVEYVDVDDVPGGDYNLTCSNKYKLLVGAKGINIKTFGPMDMYGTIINLIGEQVNISSQNEVLIDGGERFNIRARKISLIPWEHQAVVIDGQLHVTRNTVVGGGMFVEGELGLMHVTAPYEFYPTETNSGATFEPGTDDGQSGGATGLKPPGPHTHRLLDHTHVYKHISTNFMPAKEAVRDRMRTQGGN